ncbi:MAG: Mur ligase family protein, partial [Clostridia bacterium]
EKSSAIRIGITGSYGKTSTKLILARLLPQAICTPNSYNTLLGIAKFINNTDIAEYKYIIFEMGARKKGDIAKICNFVKPQHALL